MDNMMQQFATFLSEVASVLVVLACVVLYMRRRSNWIMLALIGEIGALVCRLVLAVEPKLFMELGFLRVLWPLSACVFATGLLGYAWFDTTDRANDTPQGTQP